MGDFPVTLRVDGGDSVGQSGAALPEAALVALAQDVILRLSRWARETAGSRPAPVPQQIEPDVAGLCRAMIGLDPHAARTMIRRAHDAGATHSELCLHHIGAAAHHLGLQWDAGRISSADMRVAGARALTLLRDLRDLAPPFEPRRGRCALFATVPGEDHVLGITMAADMFREDGWDLDLRLDTNEARLVDLVQAARYPIVALSASSAACLPALAQMVVALRLVAPKILIFVGGQLARYDRQLAARVGADAAAGLMEECRAEMERLHRSLPEVSRAR